MAISFNRPQNDVNISQTSSTGTDFSRSGNFQGSESSGNSDKDLTRNPLVVAGVIAGAGALAGGIANAISQNHANHTNIRLNRENNQANKELVFLQNQLNEEFWNKQNEYNKPSEQIKRLKEAGINPTLAMSQISPGTAEQLQSAELANQEAGHVNPVTGVGEGISQASQSVSNIMLQKEQLKIAQQEANTHRMDVESEVSKRTAERVKIEEETKNLTEERNRIMADVERIKADKDLKLSEKDYKEYQTELKRRFGEQEIISQLENLGASTESIKAMKELTKSRVFTETMNAWSNRIQAIAHDKTANAQVDLMNAQEHYTNKLVGAYDIQVNNMIKQGLLIDAQRRLCHVTASTLFPKLGTESLIGIGVLAK